MKMTHSTTIRVVANLGAKVFAVLCRLLTAILLGRWLGPAGYGLYAIGVSVLRIGAIPAGVGQEGLLVRVVSLVGTGEPAYSRAREIGALWGSAMGIVVTCSTGVVVAGLAAVSLSSEPSPGVYIAAIAAIPLVSLSAAQQGLLRGLNHVVQAAIPRLVVAPAITLILILIVRSQNPQPMLGVICVGIGGLASCSCAAILVMRTGQVRSPSIDRQTWKRLVREGAPFMVIAGLGVIARQIDILCLASIRGETETGLYSAASRLSALPIFTLGAINAVISPKLARLHENGQQDRLQRLVTKAMWAISASTTLSTIGLLLFAPFVFSLFGAGFETSMPILVVLVAGAAINSLCGPCGTLMLMAGHQRVVTKTFTYTCLGNLAMNLLLVPIYGAIGAAIATGATQVAWNVALTALCRSRLGIDPSLAVLLKPPRTG